MKIRNGFVSNSSSSSFIVAFPHRPKDAEETRKILFGDATFVKNPYYNAEFDCWNEPIEVCEQCPKRFECFTTEKEGRSCKGFPASEVAETVFNDIKGQKPNRPRIILRTIRDGSYDGQPKLHEFVSDKKVITTNAMGEPMELPDYDWEKYEHRRHIHARAMRKRFINHNPDSEIYIFSYGDESGEYFSVLEHGGIFDRLPHLRISYH